MIIQLMNGQIIDTSDYNLTRLFHYIPSATVNNETISLQSRVDYITTTKLNNRNIRVQFLYDTTDIYDFYLLRDQLNDIFIREEPFYIIFKKEPYKRWLVKSSSQLDIPPHPHREAFDVEFITMNGYAENIYTTSQYTNKEWDLGLYAWNNEITWDEDLSYSFNTPSFQIFNGGNKVIDPSTDYLMITVTGIGNGFGLRNLTTGDYYQYNGEMLEGDTLILNGVRSFKNGISVFGDTNFNTIKLNSGLNNFRVELLSNARVSFDFRFLYK